MANPPIVIGPFANVPAPGSPIKSDWPQQITTHIVGNWTAFTPALKAGGVAAGLGNGTRAGGFKRIGQICFWYLDWVFGAAGASGGAGVYTFDLPVQANVPGLTNIGSGHIIHGGTRYNIQCLVASAATLSMYGAPFGQVSATVPGNVAPSDGYHLSGVYMCPSTP